MAARGNTRELYLSIGGKIDGLIAGLKAGRSALAEFGASAELTAEQIEKTFADLSANPAAAATQLEKAFDRTFAHIGAQARAAAGATSELTAAQILDAGAARQSADAAQQRAAALELVAGAAFRAADATQGDTTALRIYATAAKASAIAAREQAAALGLQADALERVDAELERTTGAQANKAAAEAALERSRASAQAAAAEAAALSSLETRTHQLVASMDPAYAALMRVGNAQTILRDAFQAGIITEERYEAALGHLQAQLQQVTGAQARVNGMTGQTRNAVQQIGYNLNDFTVQVSAGQSALMAFSMQFPQTIQAIQLMAGESKGLLGILGGFWGIVFTTALAVGAPFVAMLMKGNDALGEAIQKLKDDAAQTNIDRQAKEAFTRTLEGQIDAQRRLNEETERGLKSGRTQDRIDLHRNTVQMRDAQGRLPDAQTELAAARAALVEATKKRADFAARPSVGAHDLNPFEAEVAKAETRLLAAQKQVDTLNAAIETARLGIRDVTIKLAIQNADANADPIAKIRQTYQDLRDAAMLDATNDKSGKLARTLQARLDAFRALEAAAVKAAQAEQKLATTDKQLGRQIDLSGARAIVAGIGGRVTSDHRSQDEQERLYQRYLAGKGPLAAKPGTSYHERDQALDIAKTPGMTLARIAKAFEDAGVKLVEKLDEGDHFHVAWGKKGKDPDATARDAQAAADKAERDAQAFADMTARVDAQTLKLKRDRTTSIAGLAELDKQQVDAERDNLIADIEAGVALRRWTRAQADALEIKAKQNAEDEKALIDQRAAQAAFDRALGIERDRIDGQIRILNLQEGLADTLAERRRIALRLLKLEEDEARAAAQRQIASDDPDEQARGRRALEQVNAEHALRVERIDRDNADPLDSYFRTLKSHVGDIDTAWKQVAADGIGGVVDGLTGLISGTESVAGAVKKMTASILADFARIAAEKLILSLFGMSGGGVGLGSGSSLLGHSPGHAAGLIPGFASGRSPDGMIRGPGTGLSDSILGWLEGRGLIRVANGESIITAAGTRAWAPMLRAINRGARPRDFMPGFATGMIPDTAIRYSTVPKAAALARNGGTVPSLQFDLRGALMTPELLAQINAAIARAGTAAALAGSQQAQADIAEAQSRLIPV